jgi:hypothetical protein
MLVAISNVTAQQLQPRGAEVLEERCTRIGNACAQLR